MQEQDGVQKVVGTVLVSNSSASSVEPANTFWGHMSMDYTASFPARSRPKWRRRPTKKVRWWSTIRGKTVSKKCQKLSSFFFAIASQFCPQWLNKNSRICNWSHLMVLNVPSNYVSWSWPKLPPRRGGPQLKESQVYPVQYGRRYAFLHCQWVAPGTTYGCGIILPSYGYLGSDMFASKFWIRSHLDELYHFFWVTPHIYEQAWIWHVCL